MKWNPLPPLKRFLALPWWKKLGSILAVFLSLWVIMGAPTGWIYDLGVGAGTKQGQTPNQYVSTIHTQSEVEDFFFQDIPATVPKDGLIQCPLLRLRDPEYAGEHKDARKRVVVISEYSTMDYPIHPVRKLLMSLFAAGSYNGYYLAPLEDGSYVCVYFDDYLLLQSGGDLHTGYVRYATTEEKIMLHEMAEDYEVDPVYVLDMYRHGKVNWMLDYAIRFVVVIAAGVIVMTVLSWGKKAARNMEEGIKNFSDGDRDIPMGRR